MLSMAGEKVWWFLEWLLFVGMVPVGPPLLRPDDHLLLRFYAAIMRVVQPVMHRVLQLCTRSHPNMKELLFDLEGYNNTKYKKDFTQKERPKLDNNDPSDTYDITLIFKLLQRVCGLADMNHSKWSSEGTLENCLQKLKNERNDLAHEALSFTQESFEMRMTMIKEVCRSALELAGIAYSQSVTDDVRVMEEGLKEVMTGSVDLWEPYREALQNLQQSQISTLVREGKNEIRETAEKLRILNPFVWLLENQFTHLDVGQIFTELYITAESPIPTSDLFTTPLSTGLLPRILVFHGSPGIGKTSLCRFLLHDWLSTPPTVKGLENREIFLLLELRHITSNSVEQMLREEVLPRACQHLKPDDIIPTLREASTIWLLDGYDEASSSTRELVKEILIKFPLSTIVITSRSEFVRDLQLLMSDLHLTDTNLVCRIKGFSPNNWYSYAKCLFTVSVTDKDKCQRESQKFLEYLKEHERSMWDIFSVPLFLVLLVVLWLESPALVTSATTYTKIYQILIDNIVKRISKRILLRDHGLTDRHIKKKLTDFLDLLGGILWENLRFPKHELQEHQLQELEDFCATQNLPFREVMSSFFLVTVKATVTGTVEEYQPLHRTVQEFLAARSFCNAMIAQKSDVLTVAAQWKKKSTDVKPELFDKLLNYRRLCEKENFDMRKLHLARDSNFDNYSFTDDSIFPGICPCVIILKAPEKVEDSEEFERFHCKWYFELLTIGSLVMSFKSGYLKCKGELTLARAEQILYIILCNQGNINQYSEFLKLLKEVEKDEVFVKELQDQLATFQWQPKPSELTLIPLLLPYIMPESLLVHLCDSVHEISHEDFLSRLQEVSKFPVNVCLDLEKYLLTSLEKDITFSQKCLGILFDSESKCILTGLRCPLNRTSLQMIFQASDLQDLSVTVYTLEDLHLLAEITKSLHSLHDVAVIIMISCTVLSPTLLPRFSVKPSKYHTKKYHCDDVTMTWSSSVTNLIRRENVIFLHPHVSTYPKHSGSKFSKKHRKKMSIRYSKQLKMSVPFSVQHPDHHLSKLMKMPFMNSMIKTWNIPTAHCHRQCLGADIPVLCANKCCHKPNTSPCRTLKAWQDHNRGIQYHKASVRRLKKFHKKIWELASEIYESKRLLLKRPYDPNLKLYCCPSDERVWKHMQYPRDWSIYLLKVSEYVMYEHKISIQQHLQLLTAVRNIQCVSPASEYVMSVHKVSIQQHLKLLTAVRNIQIVSPAPVRLVLFDTFKTDPQNFAASVCQICPNPLEVCIISALPESVSAYDIVKYVLKIAEVVPSVRCIVIKLVEHNFDIYVRRYYEIMPIVKPLIEMAAPTFMFNISWTLPSPS